MQIDIDSKTGAKTLKLLKSEQSAIEKSGEVLKCLVLNTAPTDPRRALADAAEKAIAAFLKG